MLRIAMLTDYALVVLAHMMGRAHVCVQTARELSEGTGIPLPTVAKVCRILTRHELLVSSRGAAGGYSLARAPSEISMADIVEAMEGPLALTRCASEDETSGCTEEHHCALSGYWPTINRAVRGALEQVTLLDLVPPRGPRRSADALADHGGK